MNDKYLTYDTVIPFLMKCKPSQLKKHIQEGMETAIYKSKDAFIEKELRNINPHWIIRAYDDLK